MADDDDYLSDKFLVESSSTPSQPKTYAQRRKEAQKQAQIKNEENRLKSRRQRELESREEGLSKSLFERAKEEEESGIGTGNKALSMMMKMGFKPGQALGKSEDNGPLAIPPENDHDQTDESLETAAGPCRTGLSGTSKIASQHKTEPIPINEWMGKKGIGLGKRARAPSPTSAERVAKMAKMAEVTSHETYRDRARQEYEERRADGRLIPAQRTCETLDEKSGKSFNVLWLNPQNPDSFPEGLIDALADRSLVALSNQSPKHGVIQSRLKLQMQADALQPLNSGLDEDAPEEPLNVKEIFTPETIEEATHFLHLDAQDRLRLVLAYLRDKHAYCFWCGTQYDGPDEMDEQCPGPEEDAHD